MTLSDFIKPVSQAAYFALMMADHLANGVPTASWTSPRNTGLSHTQIFALYLAALRALLISAVSGLFIDYATGAPLTLFAKSQYQLDRVPAQFASGMMVLTAVATAPPWSFAAGDITLGTPGPRTDNSRFFTNTEPGSLRVGQLSVPGGGQGLTLTRKSTGVTVRVVVAGMSTALSVPVVVGKAIIINQATDAAGHPTGTATQIAAAIAAQATAAVLVDVAVLGAGTFVPGTIATTSLELGTLILGFSATESGAAWNIPTGSPLDLKTSFAGVAATNPAWLGGSWLTSQGADAESDERLKLRCVSRWGTLGVGGNADAFVFWALQIPDGHTSSPVAQVNILSNWYAGAYAGGGCTVAVIGPAGALGSGDVAAVQANFDAPITSLKGPIPGLELLGKKYPVGCLVQVVSAANYTVTISGTVHVRRASGATLADVQAAVTAALTAYQQTLLMGQTIYPRKKVAGVIGQAHPFAAAIRDVDLSGMAEAIAVTILEYPVLDATGLVYELVD